MIVRHNCGLVLLLIASYTAHAFKELDSETIGKSKFKFRRKKQQGVKSWVHLILFNFNLFPLDFALCCLILRKLPDADSPVAFSFSGHHGLNKRDTSDPKSYLDQVIQHWIYKIPFLIDESVDQSEKDLKLEVAKKVTQV